MIARKGRFGAGSIVAALMVWTALVDTAAAGQQNGAPACRSAQSASPVPVHVKAPAEMLELRVADTVSKREYGLMCVRALPARTGMIFVFPDGDNFRDFWMKNTLIPLDMVFVAKSGLVNGVRANVPATKTDTPDDKIPHRDGTGSYVIELAAGEAARAGITRGTMLDVSAVVPGKD
jgi:uncharacterized protein